MHYIFDMNIATKYGLEESVFLQNIAYWTLKNMSNKVNFYDGRYWTFNSQEAFLELFPCWTRQNLRRIINSCKEKGLIVIGNYNKSFYDRTNWYALSDQGLHLLLNKTLGEFPPLSRLESTNQTVNINPPIPDVNTDINTDKKIKEETQHKKRVARETEKIDLPDWIDKELWEEFIQFRKSLKSPMSLLAQKKAIQALSKLREEGQQVDDIINQSIINGWKGLFAVKQTKEVYHADNSKRNIKDGKGPRDWQTEFLLKNSGLQQRNPNSDEDQVFISSEIFS